MNQERKISVLRNLLERVQKRAEAPRAAAAAEASSVAVVSASPSLAISAPPLQPAKTPARPGSSTLPLNFASTNEGADFRGAVSEPPAMQASQRGAASDPQIETDEGPPSAPRLRDVPEEEVAAEEREIEEEEPQLKTPPPESGKQHVTPSPSVVASELEDDISITVTMEESEVPPSVSSPAPPEVAMPMSASSRAEITGVSAPQPRLALVSEPEIELHGMTPLSGPVEPMTPAPPLSVPTATPSGVRQVPPAVAPPAPPAPPQPAATFARPGSVPDTQPSASAARQEAAPPTPPVRLMAQPLADASGKPQSPVEVWASTFTPAALHGQVASFVGHNANFGPKTFGELVRASVALGEDNS